MTRAAAAERAVDRDALGAALRRELAGEVLTDPQTLHLYSRDASMYSIRPLAVTYPRDADDVVAAVAVAGRSGVPVLARGAGTSLAGQTVGRAVVLDFSRHMRRIVGLDPERRVARVQPGVVQDQLNRAAAEHELMFGPDTSTSNRATIGGMIGNNSSGSHSIRYGTTVDHVVGLDAVLADASQARLEPVAPDERARRAGGASLEGALYRELPGIAERHREAVLRDSPRMWRLSGGYRLAQLLAELPSVDLARFVVGSEGTLALATEADVALVARPRAQAIAVGHFRSTRAAIAATHDALSLDAVAVELMDRTIIDLSRQKHEYARLSTILEGDPDALLFVTFFGENEQYAAERVEALARRWQRNGHGYHTLRALSAVDRAAVLKVRKASLGLLMAASRGSRRPLAFVEDTAVEPDQLEHYVQRFERILERHGMRAGFYGHCSVGCLHVRPFVDVGVPGEVAAMRAVAEEVLELVIECGGVNSSEHGDGLVRSEFNRRFFGPELYEAMREVKRLFDPDGRLNPGKIVDAPPMTEQLRDSDARPSRPLATHLRFADGAGMRAAADRCMNIGACRKSDEGTMCPSYMATREEHHSTRGRANALVRALSGEDPAAGLADEELHDVLDLCLECKACKTECPLGVDMASLKSEFLAHYHEAHGTPIRARMFGHIRTLNRLGSVTAPLSNLPARSALLRRLLERRLGISARRPLPTFERQSLMRWHGRRRPSGTARRGEVVFLADSFTSYTEPAVPRAAIELLERAGWRVILERRSCCGRASLSKGLLDRAHALATATVDRLGPYAGRGVPIVGCEPSCLLTLRDEYLDLLPDLPAAAAVATATRHVADLLLEAIADGDLALRLDSSLRGRTILLHGHCHEKAVTGTGASLALLRAIPGADVRELDAGCCGMAGSFGYEAEHYELSTDIGRLRLAPAIMAAPAALVAATGVSCRQQILHLTGRRARHPLELVREACEPPPRP